MRAGRSSDRSERNESKRAHGFFSDASLFTSVFVPFSKSMPHALRTARVGMQINKNAQIGTSRIRSPSQITYGWCVR